MVAFAEESIKIVLFRESIVWLRIPDKSFDGSFFENLFSKHD